MLNKLWTRWTALIAGSAFAAQVAGCDISQLLDTVLGMGGGA